MRAIAFLLLLLAAGDVAMAGTDPCARFTDADAYNYCLAGFGPAAGRRTLSKAPARELSAGPRHRASGASRRAYGAMSGMLPVARRLPAGIVQQPAPKGRVRFQIRMN
jgi:hypothetical protein